MRLRPLYCLLLLAACIQPAAADIYSEINYLRTGDGGCRVSRALPPLQREPALDRVAREMSRGAKLDKALPDAGYRQNRASVFYVTGDGVGARAAEWLAQPEQCKQLLDSGLGSVGVYLDARQVWVVMATPYAPSVDMSDRAAGRRVLALINQARAVSRSCGGTRFAAAGPVRWNETLALASRRHSEDMARNNYFSHTGRDGSHPNERVERAGYQYRATGENIAAGLKSPEEAVAGWVKSPVHCVNLMNPVFTEMGAAYVVDAQSDMGVYWTQEFGAPR